MSLKWPRWLGVLALAAVSWWALSLLEPDTHRLAAPAYESLLEELLDDGDLEEHMDADGRIQVRSVQVDGGQLCEDVALGPLQQRITGVGDRTLTVRCGLAGSRAFMSLHSKGSDGPSMDIAASDQQLPNGAALIPPLLAIFFAFLFRRVVPALLAGVVLGGFIAMDFALLPSLEKVGVEYLLGTAIDPFNLNVYGFTLVLIGMVNVCIAMGGMSGLIELVGRRAHDVRSTQLATAFMGFLVFFDDYANTVVVGGAARPLTDARKISREKLAYIVDSTAAPIAGVAFISTWIGIEIAYFGDVLGDLGSLSTVASSGYDMFFQVLPYRFYCFFAVAMVLMVAWTGRDFGPMLTAERAARRGGTKGPAGADPDARKALSRVVIKEGAPPRWANGVLPIALVVFVTIVGSVFAGSLALAEQGRVINWLSTSDLGEAFIAVGANSVQVLFAAAIAGALFAVALAIGQRILTPGEAVRAFSNGVLGMLPAILVLVLAMAIRTVAKDLHAASYMAALIGGVSGAMLPLASFLIAGGVAFATGTSWGTMAILIPVCLPLSAEIMSGLPGAELIVLLVGASILDGAIFGDHCSLISDTTVMSSVATGCDHVDHVRTQMPYSLVAMIAAALTGYLLVAAAGAAYFWIAYPAGLLFMFIVIRVFGRRPEVET